MTEEWVEESETGGRKGQKLARYDLIPTTALEAVARQYGRGATKYADRNWEKGYAWSLSYAAAQRHLNAYWGGEDWDADPYWDSQGQSRPHHLDAAIFHLMTLREFFNTHPEFDDRSKATKNPAPGASISAGQLSAYFEQAQGPRPLGDVQASRWEVP
jgi:hypothetical protein